MKSSYPLTTSLQNKTEKRKRRKKKKKKATIIKSKEGKYYRIDPRWQKLPPVSRSRETNARILCRRQDIFVTSS